MAVPKNEPLFGIHVRIPESMRDRLFALLATLRTKDPMANLTDAIRTAIDAGLKKNGR